MAGCGLRIVGGGTNLLTGGGTISDEDMAELRSQGVGQLFGPGASTRDIVDYIKSEVASRRGAGETP